MITINTPKAHIKNEKVKEEFYDFFHNVKGRDLKTVQAYTNAICEFEKFTDFQDFKTFTRTEAIDFKEHLATHKNERTGEAISKSYLRYATHLKYFLEWLMNQNGYKKHIKYNDVQYLNLTNNDRKRANSTGFQESYEVEELLSTSRKMKSNTVLEMRNKAMFALNILCTPRISALQTLRIGNLKYFKSQDAWALFQDSKIVDTKLANTITSFFIGNEQDIYKFVFDWVEYLKGQGFEDKDPLFPKFIPSFNKNGEKIIILEKKFIKSQQTIRGIFAKAFQNNGLAYVNPHSFRHSITRKALTLSQAMYIPLLSHNLGHKTGETIFDAYGTSPEHKRGVLLKGFPLGG
ncbi:MAG: site-specific recombinase XerD [Candidatus Deianiraeaceae bacterium]|jgi:site-specific recombinase XerD